MNCPHCNATIKAGDQFCTKCGAPIQTVFQTPRYCECGYSLPSDCRFCPACGTQTEGHAFVIPPPGASQEPAAGGSKTVRFRHETLLWFAGLLVIAFLGYWLARGVFGHSLGTLSLIGVTAWLIYSFRLQLAAGLQAIGRLPSLRPLWKIQAHIPKPIRYVAGVLTPFVLTYLMTPPLSNLFGGYGYAVGFVSVAMSTVVAYFFFARPPAEPMR